MTTEVTDRPADVGASPPAPSGDVAAPALSAAIVLATSPTEDGDAAALLPFQEGTVLRHLVEQAASVGAGAVHVITRRQWARDVERAVHDAAAVEASDDAASDLRAVARIAAAADGGVLVVQGEVVTQREVLAGLAADPRIATGALATIGRVGRPFAQRVRSVRGRVVSAASPYHGVSDATATFLGALKVSGADAPALAAAAERLAALAEPPLSPGWEEELERKPDGWRGLLARPGWREELDAEGFAEAELYDEPEPGRSEPSERSPAAGLAAEDEAEVRRRAAILPNDVTALLLVALVRSGVHVGLHHLRELFWARPVTAADVERATVEIRSYDEEKALLDSAVKPTDGFFTTFFVSPYSKYVARWAARRGLTPNQVTTISMLLGVLAAVAFATGERWGLVAGAVLLQIAFVADCVDGQLARYTRRFSKLGGWLDSVFDRAKEYAVFAGLAIGYAAAHAGDVWALAGAALALQTVRHMFDFSFAATRQEVIGETRQPPLEEPSDRLRATAAPAAAEAPSALSLPRRILRRWRGLDQRAGLVWAKRIAVLPIGERLALISITAAVWDAKVTFVALLACGLFALAYTTAGRVLRSVTR